MSSDERQKAINNVLFWIDGFQKRTISQTNENMKKHARAVDEMLEIVKRDFPPQAIVRQAANHPPQQAVNPRVAALAENNNGARPNAPPFLGVRMSTSASAPIAYPPGFRPLAHAPTTSPPGFRPLAPAPIASLAGFRPLPPAPTTSPSGFHPPASASVPYFSAPSAAPGPPTVPFYSAPPYPSITASAPGPPAFSTPIPQVQILMNEVEAQKIELKRLEEARSYMEAERLNSLEENQKKIDRRRRYNMDSADAMLNELKELKDSLSRDSENRDIQHEENLSEVDRLRPTLIDSINGQMNDLRKLKDSLSRDQENRDKQYEEAKEETDRVRRMTKYLADKIGVDVPMVEDDPFVTRMLAGSKRKRVEEPEPEPESMDLD